jgi:hypothetical protein
MTASRLHRKDVEGEDQALISLLYVARGLRGFGDGFAILILPAYMTILGYDAPPSASWQRLRCWERRF